MKKWLAGLLVLWMMAVPCLAVEGQVPLQAPSAVLMTLDGQVLFEKDAHTPREPASVTKVMTMLLVCEAIDSGRLSLEDPVTATAHAASMGGSQIWLEEGEVLTVGEMLKCVAVVSANDCAVALGEHLAGSEEAFVARMNQRAKELGMENTTFVNACGLTAAGHRTSAHDIGLMSAQLLREHSWICDYTTIWQDSVRNGQSVLNNTNKLLKGYEGITGLKTGYTSTAGYCVSATALREDLHLIAVIIGGESSQSRNADAAALLSWGFANFAAVQLGADRPLLPLPVDLGKQDTVALELGESLPRVLPRADLSRLEKTLELPQRLAAPIEPGQQVGDLVVRLEGKEVCRVPVLAAEGVQRLGIWDVFAMIFACLCAR
ncbi:MAG: D-alanyl-D-alanine carboxypeptidase [Clostridia bacterium]|nr:D-alanyl-D-alanine carboxypeptidase [Clostridia bacterium]